ncbi:MAG: hypothetical protein BKP49_03125 [Treponema sp. CETP13]|nr:MAG: hypothetical protein BKP49_03125 [Treponema sp. CETP13]
MLCKTNYHTHSTWCDGKASLESMVLAAIKNGLQILGFSSHTMYPFGSNWHLQPENTQAYCKEVHTLKEKYKDKIEILLGFEADYIPPVSFPTKKRYAQFNPDFLIGSVHYISDENKKKCCFTIDGNCDEIKTGIQTCFNGNAKKAVQVYYATQRDMIALSGFDIIGHLDVIRKRNDVLKFFDETDLWYKREIKATAQALAKSNLIAEINTGGMARAGLKTPYPSAEFLKLLNHYDIPIMINSDAHKPEGINAQFKFAEQYAKDAGYKEVQYLQNGTWKSAVL